METTTTQVSPVSAQVNTPVSLYVEGTSKAGLGNTGYLVFYRTDSKTKVKKPSKFVALPTIANSELVATMDRLLPMLGKLVEDKRLELVREAVDAGATELNLSEYTLSKVIEYSNSVATGARFSKALVEAWFNDTVQARLVEAMLAKNPNISEEQISQTVKNSLELVLPLTGLKAAENIKWAQVTIDHVKKVLALVAGDEVAAKLLGVVATLKPVNPTVEF